MKIDLHVHTSENSGCGKVPAKETIRLYKDAGYDAIVLTDHYSIFSVQYLAKKGRNDYAAAFHEAYADAVQYGKEAGLLVLCGYELRFNCSDNDYLVYGMPRSLCEDYAGLMEMDPASFSELAKKHNILFYQAHPFRNGMSVTRPEYLFGIEVKNGNPRHDSRNDIAQIWAEKFHLHRIAGSDCHQIQDAGSTGIETKEIVRNMDDLIHVLRNDLYTIL